MAYLREMRIAADDPVLKIIMANKKPFMGRDYLLLKIIGGATKSGVQPDRKKEANKTASRGKKMNRANQGQNQAQQNTMQLTELKALKETVAKQKKTIETLQDEVKILKALLKPVEP